MPNPLRFTDLLGNPHVEPGVYGLMEVQTSEPIPPSAPPQDLLILSSFRSGQPQVVNDFETLSALQNIHDPDYNGDEGVALARMARAGFGDIDVFGAGRMKTVRVDPALNSSTMLMAGAATLLKIETADYGVHTKRSRRTVENGTQVGKKVTLADDVRSFVLDNLGIAFTLQYTGNGTTATATINYGTAMVTYSGVPSAGDGFTINGVVFQFHTGTAPGAGIVGVLIVTADADATFANAVTAINANVPNIEGVTQDTSGLLASGHKVVVHSEEQGATIVEGTDTGNKMACTTTVPAARLTTTVSGQTDGSINLDIPLKLSGYSTLDRLVSAINVLGGGFYTATISPYANQFMPSNGLDTATAQNIKTLATFTAYVAAIADAVNTRTRSNYRATEVARGVPDNAVAANFTGGSTPVATFADYREALDVAGANIEKGAVVLLNSDDPSIISAAATWVIEQRALGKHFRLYAGLAPALTAPQIISQAAVLDQSRVHVTSQRLGVFSEGSTPTYLHPSFFAAALAGGAAGNLPWVKTLTNKRLRVIGIHPDDVYPVTIREQLIGAGVTLAKQEEDRTVVVLHVTTNRDPIRRMPRVASEIATVDIVDGQMREAFLQFRGAWAGTDIGARIFLVGSRVLNNFVSQGALTKGVSEEGEQVPPWRWLPIFQGSPFVIQAGVLKLAYQIWIGGELNHISLRGIAEYQRIVQEISGGRLVNLTTAVPVR